MNKKIEEKPKRKKKAAVGKKAAAKQKKSLIKRMNFGTSPYRKQKRPQIDRRRRTPKTLSEQREQQAGRSLKAWMDRHRGDITLMLIPFFVFCAISVYALTTDVDLPIAQVCVAVSESLFGATGVIFYILLIAFIVRYALGNFECWRNGSYEIFGCLFFAYFLVLLVIQRSVNEMLTPLPPTRVSGYIANFVIYFLKQIVGNAGTVILLICGGFFLAWKIWQIYAEKEGYEDIQAPIKAYWEEVFTANDVNAEEMEQEQNAVPLLRDMTGDFSDTYGLLTAEETQKDKISFQEGLKKNGSFVKKNLRMLKDAFVEISKPVVPDEPFPDLDDVEPQPHADPFSEEEELFWNSLADEEIDFVGSSSQTDNGDQTSAFYSRLSEETDDVKPCVVRTERLYDADDKVMPDTVSFGEPLLSDAFIDETPSARVLPERKPDAVHSATEGSNKPRMPRRNPVKEFPSDTHIHASASNKNEAAPHRWALPDADELLDPIRRRKGVSPDDPNIRLQASKIENLLETFGAPGKVVDIQCGPTFSQFGVEPGFVERSGRKTRVRIKQIENLKKDLEMELSVEKLSIEAPIPNKTFVGIQVQNKSRVTVTLREVMENEAFRDGNRELSLALGKDINGQAYATDLTRMPHLLIAGATGSGKSVCLNAILSCLLLQYTPDQLKLVLVDPKRVELSNYNGLPHLVTPVVTEIEQVGNVLQWLLREMDMRNLHFLENGVRNIQEYNRHYPEKALPYIVLVIDELANLMAEAASDVESSIIRLAQTARAMGIHLIIATQRPSRDVLTGTIKGNLPTRIAFGVASHVDSQVILDRTGAENLFGKGDMFFLSTEETDLKRLQCVYVSDAEIHRIVAFWKNSIPLDQTVEPSVNVARPVTTRRVRIPEVSNGTLTQLPLFNEAKPDLTASNGDVLYDEAVKLVRLSRRASANLLVSRMSIGYSRANKLLARMEDEGIISPPNANPAIPREVLDYGPYAPQDEADEM